MRMSYKIHGLHPLEITKNVKRKLKPLNQTLYNILKKNH